MLCCLLLIPSCHFFLQEQRLDIGGGMGKRIVFEPIEKFLRSSDFERLEDKKIGKEDLEIRMWIVVSPSLPVSGYFFSRENAKWSGVIVGGIIHELKGTREYHPLISWEHAISELTDAGIFTLPDYFELPQKKTSEGEDTMVLIDAKYIVVETKSSKEYRAYHYPIMNEPEGFFDDPYAIECMHAAHKIYSFFRRGPQE